jgi:hypothetical protein
LPICHNFSTDASNLEISHSLCNDFYIYAFEDDYLARKNSKCLGCLDVNTLPAGYKMGYMETRRR